MLCVYVRDGDRQKDGWIERRLDRQKAIFPQNITKRSGEKERKVKKTNTPRKEREKLAFTELKSDITHPRKDMTVRSWE